MSEEPLLHPNQPAISHTDDVSNSPAPFELRPLSTGEILDRGIYLYRSRFALFIGLSLPPAIISVAGQALRLSLMHWRGNTYALVLAGIFQIVTAILAWFVLGITQAATSSAVSSIYLGEATSIAAAFGSIVKRWYRYIAIAIWQVWSGSWLMVLLVVAAGAASGARISWLAVSLLFLAFASLVYGVIAYIRNSLAVPASVVESSGVRASIRRSKQLVSGRKGRIFLMFVLVIVLYMVMGMIEMPFALIIARSPMSPHTVVEGILLLINFICQVLVAPVSSIALSLFYFDERVRREGFDIEFLLAHNTISPESA
ncbi:hypothetical protein GCM10011507_26000 [Edaphobacter acidisoli]|uniref:Glycerophosphoryl diester phosphodiesterase membrane domain-containing protein n=1 Tax=Edaphobacter acidisoli TaxID=2040573 RepID=A0A916RVV1_9BACT|nr:hypothetical protein [Edaphobacter acidisoli]GGA73189.1 hypothetical protein GCM10011507_26000 [Edaphobacter acidisoli]